MRPSTSEVYVFFLLWYPEKLAVLFSTQDDPIGNINLAMEIAEKHLDIPKMLDAEGEVKSMPTKLQKTKTKPKQGNLWTVKAIAEDGNTVKL